VTPGNQLTISCALTNRATRPIEHEPDFLVHEVLRIPAKYLAKLIPAEPKK
jgi:hypothetical protein